MQKHGRGPLENEKDSREQKVNNCCILKAIQHNTARSLEDKRENVFWRDHRL